MAILDERTKKELRKRLATANDFPRLSEEFGVQGVPPTVVNRSGSFVGALPPAAFVEQVVQLASAQAEAV